MSLGNFLSENEETFKIPRDLQTFHKYVRYGKTNIYDVSPHIKGTATRDIVTRKDIVYIITERWKMNFYF
jgi:hypothetical protein